jgi:5-formyltetrahydrofolate cyclo-ligase
VADETPRAKEQLRAALLASRQRLTTAERAAAGDAIRRHGIDRWPDARTVAAYLSVAAEPPTQPLLDALVASGVRVLLPVITDAALDWAAYSGPGDVTRGLLGINEPTGPRLGADALSEADLVLVPAVAVDRAGHRLGRGRGYYDRALVAVTAPVVAIVYDEELLDAVPTESHDRSIDGVLRPAGFTSLPGLPV